MYNYYKELAETLLEFFTLEELMDHRNLSEEDLVVLMLEFSVPDEYSLEIENDFLKGR